MALTKGEKMVYICIVNVHIPNSGADGHAGKEEKNRYKREYHGAGYQFSKDVPVP
jgi:hypothetical protein